MCSRCGGVIQFKITSSASISLVNHMSTINGFECFCCCFFHVSLFHEAGRGSEYFLDDLLPSSVLTKSSSARRKNMCRLDNNVMV